MYPGQCFFSQSFLCPAALPKCILFLHLGPIGAMVDIRLIRVVFQQSYYQEYVCDLQQVLATTQECTKTMVHTYYLDNSSGNIISCRHCSLGEWDLTTG